MKSVNMKPINRVPVVRQVEESIRKLIEEEAFKPGEKLPTETDLCQQLSVGRGTVREAFRLLQARGIVEIKPGRGAFVAGEPTMDMDSIDWFVQNERELQDFLELRAAIEPMTARRMAESCAEESLQRLAGVHQEFLRASQRGDPEEIARIDEQFHSTIVESCGNNLMSDINRRICKGMQLFRSYTFRKEQNVHNAVVPHSYILNAILERDADRAEREMRIHLDMVKEDLMQKVAIPDDQKPNV
jgi:GntR family transcriptional repressor for pyruvate dehydrogenase complex